MAEASRVGGVTSPGNCGPTTPHHARRSPRWMLSAQAPPHMPSWRDPTLWRWLLNVSPHAAIAATGWKARAALSPVQ